MLIFSLSYTIVVPKREDMAVQKKKKNERGYGAELGETAADEILNRTKVPQPLPLLLSFWLNFIYRSTRYIPIASPV